MKISLNWLKEYIDFKLSPKELAEKIDLSVVEVDEINDFRKIYKDVFVGEIKEIKKHPHADRLSVAKVSLGKKTIQIIFGTLQLKVGDKLPIVLAPATLPTGLEVEKTDIRGIESQGMIASTKELGLDYSAEEVIFFNSDIKAGTPLVKALKIDDTVLNLDVLSNRGDLFSHLGVAREVAAILRKRVKKPRIKVSEDKTYKINKMLEVEIKDKDLCSRYEARVIKDVKIKESPTWLKNRLLVLGIRPINNIVDITNYVMMEMGQPLHVFDYNKLAGSEKKKKIIVRRAKTKEEILTLDEKQRKLTKGILTIADSQSSIAVAGVIGGKNTEVDEETTTIILESASFNWVSIRRASRILGLRTEAVIRFEKGLDSNLTEEAIERAAQLISEISGGKVVSGKIDKNYSKDTSKIINLSSEKLDRFLGQKNSSLKIGEILASLGMEAELSKEKAIVKIPSFRKDIKEEADLIEEVARIFGYDKIPATLPITEIIPTPKNKVVDSEDIIKELLVGLGITEVYNYTFLGEELLEKFGETPEGYYSLQNPLNMDHTYLRKNLVFSNVETAEFNAKNFDEFSIFEISRVFLSGRSKMPDEKQKISVLTYAKKDAFYKLKGILEELFAVLSIKDIKFSSYNNYNHDNFWHPQKAAHITFSGINVGKIGELHPEVLGKFNFSNKVAVCEIDFTELIKKQEEKVFIPFSRFPKIVLDFAIIIDEKLAEVDIRKEIARVSKELVCNIELFDVYRGKQIEAGKKSLAYHVTYQSDKKTLTDEEAGAIHSKIIKNLSKKFNAKIRG